MITLIDRLQNLIKSYTVAAYSANTTGSVEKRTEAETLLKSINDIRLTLAVNAEMRDIFVQQYNIPASANTTTQQNITCGKNDLAFTYKRGIANLIAANVFISLLNQGTSAIEITRNQVNWQSIFADIERASGAERGQQTLFDFPETLFFAENQTLNVGIQGQNAAGQIFLHGATLKDELTNAAKQDLLNEFVDKDTGRTKYLPETQIVPLRYQFTSATAGTLATGADGSNDIFSEKSDRSVLLLDVSITGQLCRIDKLTDEGRNQTICERVEAAGVASQYDNRYTAYYPLPEPHLLRRGDRLKTVMMQGSIITGTSQPINVINTLAFRGITV